MKKILRNISLLIFASSIIFTKDVGASSNSAENTQILNQTQESIKISNEETPDLVKKNSENALNSSTQSEYQACLMFMQRARFKSEADSQAYKKKCEKIRDNSTEKQ